jgi:lambda family phage portal protein
MKEIKVKTTGFDKAIEMVAPRIGVKRREARLKLALFGAYEGASKRKNSMKKWSTTSGDADTDLEDDRLTLIDRSRDLTRNSPLAVGAINTNCINIIGSGLKLHARIDAEYLGISEDEADLWEKQTEREFKLWSESQECDVERILDFYEMQDLAMRQVLENGDVFILPPRVKSAATPYYLKLQMIEADRVCNDKRKMNGYTDTGNRLYDGIEKDKSGAPFKYHICKKHPGNLRDAANLEWDVVPAFSKSGMRNVLHLYKMLRPGQSRGIPYIAPVIECLKQLKEYTEAELMAAVVSAMLTVFIKSETGDTKFSSTDPSENTTGTSSDMELGNGAIIGLAPGEDVSTVNPGRPNSMFDPFVTSILKQIGVGLDLPFEVLTKSFMASYSASRAALLEAWRMFKTRRMWFANKFCRPVYELWMYEAVGMGRIIAPGFYDDPLIRKAYLGSQWVGPSQGQLDPTKEVDAATSRVNLMISTIERETEEYSGEDFDRLQAQIRKEQAFKKEIQGTTGAVK